MGAPLRCGSTQFAISLTLNGIVREWDCMSNGYHRTSREMIWDVVRDTRITESGLRVLLAAIAMEWEPGDEVSLTTATIQQKAGLKSRAIERGRSNLEELGYLVKRSNSRRGNNLFAISCSCNLGDSSDKRSDNNDASSDNFDGLNDNNDALSDNFDASPGKYILKETKQETKQEISSTEAKKEGAEKESKEAVKKKPKAEHEVTPKPKKRSSRTEREQDAESIVLLYREKVRSAALDAATPMSVSRKRICEIFKSGVPALDLIRAVNNYAAQSASKDPEYRVGILPESTPFW